MEKFKLDQQLNQFQKKHNQTKGDKEVLFCHIAPKTTSRYIHDYELKRIKMETDDKSQHYHANGMRNIKRLI